VRLPRPYWFSIAVPPVAGSFVVLAVGGVGQGIWLLHLLAIGAACVVAVAGNRLTRRTPAQSLAAAVLLLTLAGLAVPMLLDRPGPDRWVALGPWTVYLAPLCLPAFLAVCVVRARRRSPHGISAFAALLGASLLLAAQPDASQVLALLVGAAVGFVRYRAAAGRSAITLGAIAGAAAWAFSRPDPLEPVAYVEGVVDLALGHSLLAALVVIVGAISLVLGLCAGSVRGPAWLAAVAAYYAVLFGCSLAGLTPAPLIGYGAGPLLGFGLLVAVSRSVDPAASPDGTGASVGPG
jgi:hypothetical protein